MGKAAVFRSAPVVLGSIAAMLVTGCSDGGGVTDAGNDPATAPAISVVLGSATLAVTRGQEEAVAVTVSRTGGYTGAVSLSLEGAPPGTTGSFEPASIPGGSTTSTLRLAVSAETETGTHDLTVRASGTGVSAQTASLALAVHEPEGFAVAVAPSSLSIMQGASESATVTLTRHGGFGGAVSLDASGTPNGLDAGADPSTVTGTSSTLTVTAAADLAPGTYPLTVQGTAEIDGQTRQETATLTITVTESVAGHCPGPLTNGDNHLCTIAVPEQLHEWTFTAAAGDYVTLSMSRVEGDLQPWIRLLSPTGEELADERHTEVIQISMNVPATGTYTVIVGSKTVNPLTFLGTGHYLLRLAQVPGEFVVPAGDDGGPLTNGQSHPGHISLGDLDMWTFTANQGDYVALTMSRLDGDLNPWIRLISPAGEELASERRRDEVTQVSLNVPATGTYTVIVGSRTSNPFTFLGTGDYLLRLAQAPGEFVVPGGDEGGPLTIGENHPGHISLGDLDIWTFSATVGAPITITMSRVDGDLNPWVRLVSPTGELLESRRHREEVQFDLTLPTSGTYTVIAGSRTSNPLTFLGTGDYLLRVSSP